jgi:PKHD-type hydroxylase
MLVRAPAVLTAQEIAHCRRVLEAAEWVDGKITAGAQSAQAKFNLQVPENAPQAKELGELILRALGRNPIFNAAALPFKVFPPLFNRYDEGMRFDAHVDNAIRYTQSGARIRTDVSTTLFLSEPEEYDGGELVIQDTFGEQRVKLAAGDLIIYPATSLHRVEPITRGARWASFFWTQSMIKDDGDRALLFSLDTSIQDLRAQAGETPQVLSLTNVYHNLLRRWAEV